MSAIQCVDCDDWIDPEHEDVATTDDGNVCCACAEIRSIEAEADERDKALDDPRRGQADDLNRGR